MQYPEIIYDKDNKPVRRSRNLAGIREHVGKYLIDEIAIEKFQDESAMLYISFDNGDWYETSWGSFSALCGVILRWRNLYGAPIYHIAHTHGEKKKKLLGKVNQHLEPLKRLEKRFS